MEGKDHLNRLQCYQHNIRLVDSHDSSAFFRFSDATFGRVSDVIQVEQLSFQELLAGTNLFSLGSQEKRMHLLFMMFNTPNSGYWNAQNVEQLLCCHAFLCSKSTFCAFRTYQITNYSSIKIRS